MNELLTHTWDAIVTISTHVHQGLRSFEEIQVMLYHNGDIEGRSSYMCMKLSVMLLKWKA